MKTDTFNKSLANIEDSLKKMETAREQVEKVTNSGNDLTIATNKLAKDVKSLAVEVKTELLTTISSFSEHLNLSDKGINSKLDLSDNFITEKLNATDKYITKKLDATEKCITEKLDVTDKNIAVKLDGTNINITEKIDKFREYANKLRDNSKVAIASVTKLSEDSLKSQNEAILETIKSINSYIATIQTLIEVIHEANIPNKLDDIKQLNNEIKLSQAKIIDYNKSLISKLEENKYQIKKFIEVENYKIKENFKLELEKSTTVLKSETKSIKIAIWIIGLIIIIQSAYLISKLIQ